MATAAQLVAKREAQLARLRIKEIRTKETNEK
jgi:hypothetical protein